MANGVYNRGKFLAATAAVNLGTADLRVLLVKSTYAFDATHNFVADVVAGSQEISAAGYARQTLAGKTVTEDDVNGFAFLAATDPVFPGMAAGQTIGGMVLFIHTGSDATAQVLAFYDLTDTLTNGLAVTVAFALAAAGGVLKLA
jgi:hypothetical protein